MGENKIYDTSAVIEIIKRGTRQRIAFISVLTAVEYPPALHYAEVVLYPTKKDYALRIAVEHKVTVYDALFTAFALKKSLEFVTVDEKQAEVAKALGVKIVLV
jgi:predicted nucleic acid-binding protein